MIKASKFITHNFKDYISAGPAKKSEKQHTDTPKSGGDSIATKKQQAIQLANKKEINSSNTDQKTKALAFKAPLTKWFPNIDWDILDHVAEGKVNPESNAVTTELNEISKECGFNEGFLSKLFTGCMSSPVGTSIVSTSKAIDAHINNHMNQLKLECSIHQTVCDSFMSVVASNKATKNLNHEPLVHSLLLDLCEKWHKVVDTDRKSEAPTIKDDQKKPKNEQQSSQDVADIIDTLVDGNKQLPSEIQTISSDIYSSKCNSFSCLLTILPPDKKIEFLSLNELPPSDDNFYNLEGLLNHHLEEELINIAKDSLSNDYTLCKKDLEHLENVNGIVSKALKIEGFSSGLLKVQKSNPDIFSETNKKVTTCIFNTTKTMFEAVTTQLAKHRTLSSIALKHVLTTLEPFLIDETERAKLTNELYAEDDTSKIEAASRAQKGKRKTKNKKPATIEKKVEPEIKIESETISQVFQSIQNIPGDLPAEDADFITVNAATNEPKKLKPNKPIGILNSFCANSKNASSGLTPVPSKESRLVTNKFKNISFFPTKKNDGKPEPEIVAHLQSRHQKTCDKLASTDFSRKIGKDDPNLYDKICHLTKKVIDSNSLQIEVSNKYQPDPTKKEYIYLDSMRFSAEVKIGNKNENITCVFSMPDETNLEAFRRDNPQGHQCLIMRTMYIDKM